MNLDIIIRKFIKKNKKFLQKKKIKNKIIKQIKCVLHLFLFIFSFFLMS